LGEEGLDEMAKSSHRARIDEPGVEVIVQGELKADHFFVIASGTFEADRGRGEACRGCWGSRAL